MCQFRTDRCLAYVYIVPVFCIVHNVQKYIGKNRDTDRQTDHMQYRALHLHRAVKI